MIQENLTNIVKHARATDVSVVITKNEEYTLFSIEDNGTGFNVRETLARDSGRTGLGLSAMQERTRMLKGSLDISSREGEGTKISFTVPHREGGLES
jgi:signal transduction histidine kinase